MSAYSTGSKHVSARYVAVCVLSAIAFLSFCHPALALITGGEGNEPIRDPGWPAGAAAIFNFKGRVAYWEGPPYGGGQWHSECRGDAKDLNAILAAFAQMDAKNKRIYVHDGVGASFWLNPNRKPEKAEAAKIDWRFMVWQKANWDRLFEMPARLRPGDAGDPDLGPPTQIDIYTGGNVRWADVVVPEGITVFDRRLEAHGFSLEDGTVLEGKVVDAETKEPIAGKFRLERVEPRKTGGYDYPLQAEVAADKDGRWVMKKVPAGWYRLVVVADGYVARVVAHEVVDTQPSWSSYDCSLLCPAPVSGVVTDQKGKPLADVDVRIGDIEAKAVGGYDSPGEYKAKTDAEGRFRVEEIPPGKATIWVHKAGYVRPGLGPAIEMPARDVKLEMQPAANLVVTIDFSATTRPGGYIVHIAPEGGEKVGSWGGSGNIDAENQITFKNVPPGRYVLTSRPNPGSAKQETEPVTVELKGGDEAKVTLKAK